MRKTDLQLLVERWHSGTIKAEEAMKAISLSLAKPPKPVKQKREIEYDVAGFMSMANAIVDSRKSKPSI